MHPENQMQPRLLFYSDSFRVVPGNMEDGLIINCLPRHLKDAYILMRDDVSRDRVMQFQLSGPGLKYFEDEMHVDFYEIPDISVSFLTEQLPPPGTLKALPSHAYYSIDFIDSKPAKQENQPIRIDKEKEFFILDPRCIDPSSDNLVIKIITSVYSKIK